jgi:KDO2-lipid IV(A) lauroyltransferase
MTFDDMALMHSCDVDPRGVIFAVSHSGNFDLTGVWWTEFNARPVGAITKPLENAAFNQLLHEARFNRNIIVFSSKSPTVVSDVNALVRSGNNLCVLPDQNARTRGVAVDFLGKPASTYKGAAKTYLVNRDCARLVVGVPTRIDGGRKHMVYVREIDDFEPSGDEEQDVKALTQRISTIMGERVRAHPESYLWHHRRWHKPDKANLPKVTAPPA